MQTILGFIDPIAFQLGPITVRWYGLTFVVAILAAIFMTERAAKHRGKNPDFIADLAMVIVPAGILGARLYEVFVLQWPYYREHPSEILMIWRGGLAIHGGVIGALILGGLFLWYKKERFWLWTDLVAPGLILAQAIGRWGNFFNQEAYGSPAPVWLIDKMPGWLRDGMFIEGQVMHPTFLYESVWNLLCFGVLFAYQRRKPPEGTVFSLYFILYNIGRITIESIREDSSYVFGHFRVAQLMALAQIVIGLVLLVYHYRRARHQTATTTEA